MTNLSRDEDPERVVVRDKRRIDPLTGQVRAGVGASGPDAGAPTSGDVGWDAEIVEGVLEEPGATPTVPGEDLPGDDPVVEDLRRELAESEDLVAERTGDLQRVQAQFINYKRRAERDVATAGAAATADLLAALLPLLDDIERARAHGDLTGGFRAVAEGLEQLAQQHGLVAFGEPGDAFDPAVHEAVTHALSPDVAQVECSAVLRRGYRVGDRLLRAAMVAVVEPAEPDLTEPDDPTQ